MWSIAFKDLRLMMRDRRALGVLVLMPMVFIAILGASTGQLLGMNERAALVRAVVADEAHDRAAEVVDGLRAGGSFSVETVETAVGAFRRVDDGDAAVAIVFGSGWSERVDQLTLRDLLVQTGTGGGVEVERLDIAVYARPSNPVVAAAARVMLTSSLYPVLMRQAAGHDPVAAMYLSHTTPETPVHPDAVVDAGDSGGGIAGDTTDADPAPDDGLTAAAPGFQAGVYQFIVPGYAVMFAFFLINIMARSFIAERAAGTLPRLRLAPLATWQVLAGKTVPFLIVSAAQGLLLFGFGRALFGMSWGVRPWLLLPVIVCTSLAATGLGLLTALSGATDAQVSAYGNLLVIALAGISGCFMPRDWLPDLLRQISLATPHAWSLIAYDQLLVSGHPDLSRVALNCLVLVLFAAVFALAACWRWRAMRRD